MIVTHIAAREFRALFLSPVAWVVLGFVQFILGFLFLAQLDEYLALQPRLLSLQISQGITEMLVSPLLGVAGFICLLVVPLLTMRSISEERRRKTLSLLLSAPIAIRDIVLGKYLGLLGFLLVMLLLISLMPLSLLLGSNIDLGQLAAGLLGLGLLMAAFAAIGLFLSSLTADPVLAAMSTFGVLLLLWIIDWAGKTGGQGSAGIFAQLSMLRHYEYLLRGIFSSRDIVYYVVIIGTFLTLTAWRLDMDRVQG